MTGAPPRPSRTSRRRTRHRTQRRHLTYAVAAIVGALAILAAVVAVGVTESNGRSAARQPMTAADLNRLRDIPLSTLTAAARQVGQLAYANPATGGTLTSAGKPELLYVGAEFCPYCAAERWAMTIALLKFGDFTNLQTTHSAQSDGDVGTISFYGSTYSSPYLTFEPYELYTNQPSGAYYKALDALPSSDQAVWAANEPSGQTFPFIDFAGRYTLQAAQYPLAQISYRSFSDVMSTVGNNSNPLGAYIDASAALFIKYLSGMTQDQPASVRAAVASLDAPVIPATTAAGA